MRWHTITLTYPTELTDDQENILIVNWREVRKRTAETLLKQSRKTGNIAHGMKLIRAQSGETVTGALSSHMANVANDIHSHFALEKKNGHEYALMISEAVLGQDDGRIRFKILGRDLTLADTLKGIAHRFWNNVSKDMGFKKEEVRYAIGVSN